MRAPGRRIVLVASTVLLLLTGCSRSDVAVPVAQDTATATTTATEPSAFREASPEPQACPATKQALTKALNASTTLDHFPLRSSTIKCTAGWAVAKPETTGDGLVVFRYDAGAQRWTAVVIGSSIDCGSIGMPLTVGTKLDACFDEK